jgi:hypothetical protein
MKKLATLATIAIVALGASPAIAGDLEYALAFESKVRENAQFFRSKNMKYQEYVYRLESRFNIDRERMLNDAGKIKSSMCASGKDDDALKNAAKDHIKGYYAKLPKTAINDLDQLTDSYAMIVLIGMPC